jgi:hypothetical protein
MIFLKHANFSDPNEAKRSSILSIKNSEVIAHLAEEKCQTEARLDLGSRKAKFNWLAKSSSKEGGTFGPKTVFPNISKTSDFCNVYVSFELPWS